MIAPVEMQQKLAQVFSDRQAFVLTDVIQAAYSDLVRTSDFNELKEIVRDLAVAQKRTEQRVEELATAQENLAIAQEKLATAQEKLTTAQHGTELALQQLSRQVGVLSGRLDNLAEQVGGLSDRMGGDLEDIAASVLPDVLMREYGGGRMFFPAPGNAGTAKKKRSISLVRRMTRRGLTSLSGSWAKSSSI
jgi:hypothetical protein